MSKQYILRCLKEELEEREIEEVCEELPYRIKDYDGEWPHIFYWYEKHKAIIADSDMGEEEVVDYVLLPSDKEKLGEDSIRYWAEEILVDNFRNSLNICVID
jgi:hypothetical protein